MEEKSISMPVKYARQGAKKVKEIISIPDSVGVAAFYIINYENDQGFAVVSAEKKIIPILAYADKGQFQLNQINPGVSQWMREIKTSVQIFRKDKNLKSTAGADAGWAKYMNGESTTNNIQPPTDPPGNCNQFHTVSNMISTNWGQGAGYNAACPTRSDGPCGRAVTGCVATAMAQVMRYHNYPNSYSWNTMPPQSQHSCSISAGESEMSRLIGDAGNAVDMDYGGQSSGAYASKVESALENRFGYSTLTERFVFGGGFKAELDNGRPLILDGGDHMWVCSGYQTYDIDCGNTYMYLWMNWGWDGTYDGWYAYDNWAPPGYNFNDGKSMIHVHKP